MRLNPEVTADLVTFTEEIPNGKLYFLCSECINCEVTTNKKKLTLIPNTGLLIKNFNFIENLERNLQYNLEHHTMTTASKYFNLQ